MQGALLGPKVIPRATETTRAVATEGPLVPHYAVMKRVGGLGGTGPAICPLGNGSQGGMEPRDPALGPVWGARPAPPWAPAAGFAPRVRASETAASNHTPGPAPPPAPADLPTSKAAGP